LHNQTVTQAEESDPQRLKPAVFPTKAARLNSLQKKYEFVCQRLKARLILQLWRYA
jgi:hypothetical protein